MLVQIKELKYGEIEEQKRIVKNLKKAGEDTDFISQVTGLTKEEIEKIN